MYRSIGLTETKPERHKLELNINTERLRFGKWATEQLFFTFYTKKTFLVEKRKQRPEKCSHELQANMAEYSLCFERSGRSNSRSAGRSLHFSKETSWGVPAGAAWSPQTRRDRPPPADQECEKTAGCSLKKIKMKVKEERREELSGCCLRQKTPPLNHRCRLPVSPAASSWSPGAQSLNSSGDTERQKTERRKAIEEEEVKWRIQGGEGKGRKQSREADKQLVRRWHSNRKWKSSEATQRLCWHSEDFISK